MSDGAQRGDCRPPWVLVESGELGEVGALVCLARDEGRHLTRVLRRKTGDEVVLADGMGAVARGVIETTGAETRVRLEELRTDPVAPAANIRVALGILTSQAMDWALQKAVELGVGTVLPLLTERTQMGRHAAKTRREHWQRVAQQALKQCHRSWAMEIAAPLELAELLRDLDPRETVYGHADGRWCSDVGDEVSAQLLLTGPEGGFSGRELGMLRDAGVPGIRFGPHVLRAETAVTVGAAWLVARQYVHGTGRR